MACIGALITILSIFLDAMAQNVLATGIRVENGAIDGLAAGQVPRSEIYNLSSQSGLTGLTMRMFARSPHCTTALTHLIQPRSS